MINIKNIVRVLLIALFVCVWSENASAQCSPACKEGYECVNTSAFAEKRSGKDDLWICKKKQDTSTEAVVTGSGGANDPTFCGSGYGIFTGLVTTGQMIFKRLRDLIYVVAGFGIIAVAVGGFFGNLNWKWLGAIVISLVVIATAGELIVLMTGCESFGTSLITNTLTAPTGMSTQQYNDAYTEEYKEPIESDMIDSPIETEGNGQTIDPAGSENLA